MQRHSSIACSLLQWLPWRRGVAQSGSPGRAAHQSTHLAPTISTRPFIGVLAVLVGAIISTLDTRITSFGLADVRGAVHAGFDEGAWITTAFTVGQMLVGPVAAWLGAVF